MGRGSWMVDDKFEVNSVPAKILRIFDKCSAVQCSAVQHLPLAFISGNLTPVGPEAGGPTATPTDHALRPASASTFIDDPGPRSDEHVAGCFVPYANQYVL